MASQGSEALDGVLARFLAVPERHDGDVDALIAALPQAILIGDQRGLLRVNPPAVRLFDASWYPGATSTYADFSATSRVLHSSGGHHLTRTELPFNQALLGRFTTCDAHVDDPATGRSLTLRCNGAPIFRGGDQVGAVAVYADVSDLRRTTEVLNRANRELREFTAIAAHDLREPLRLVDSLLQLAGMGEGARGDERAQRFLDSAADHVKRMQHLLDGLLDLTRAGQQKLARVRVACNGVVQEAMENLHITLHGTGAEVMASALPEVQADRALLVQLFQHLIGNAVTYARTGVPPRIQIDARRRVRDTLFTVRDNGIGINPEDRTRVFTPFDRLGEKSATPGAGLGLTVCRRIIARHRGDIWVDSAPGGGCEFMFTIPHDPVDGALEPRGLRNDA